MIVDGPLVRAEGRKIQVFLSWDDVTGVISSVWAINDTEHTAQIVLKSANGRVRRAFDIPPDGFSIEFGFEAV